MGNFKLFYSQILQKVACLYNAKPTSYTIDTVVYAWVVHGGDAYYL